MAHESKAIQKLPVATRTQLRSTQIITSLPQVVSELVQNALDANAKHIDVGIHFEEWMCTVRDDGSGVAKDVLSILSQGGEAGRYGSSKIYEQISSGSQTNFGFRGEALASMADLSCLEISSRTAQSHGTWSLILKGGKRIFYGPAVRWTRESPGTMVCIRDAFFNVPVRRTSHASYPRTLEMIRKDLETCAIMSPTVAFTMEDIPKENEKMGKGRIMTIPKTTSILARFAQLYGAHLADNVEDVSAASGDIRLEGFISKDGSQSKAHQFFYINRHPMSFCDFHRTIEKCFASSSFAKRAVDELGEDSLPKTGSRRSPRKVERRPIYILNLTVPSYRLDNFLEPAKATVHVSDTEAVLQFLADVIHKFLRKHGFISGSRQQSSTAKMNTPSPSPRKRLKNALVEESSARIPTRSGAFHNPALQSKSQSAHPPLFANIESDCAAETKWIDPATGEVFIVDTRTGNSYPLHQPLPEEEPGKARRTLIDTSSLKRRRSRDGGDKEVMPEWLEGALRANDTYNVTEASVRSLPSMSISKPEDAETKHQGTPISHRPRSLFENLRGAAVDGFSRSFSANDLKNARVICQVDKKFVACILQSSEERTLVLVDQHAADERIRAERFLEEICRGHVIRRIQGCDLDPPKSILLTQSEHDTLQRLGGIARDLLASWGFTLRDRQDSEPPTKSGKSGEFVQVDVATVPDLICEKLLIGHELQNVIRSILSDEDVIKNGLISSAAPLASPLEAGAWIKVIHRCPTAIVDLINSKACRGAVMFNDTLSFEQCERLIDQLSATAYPFQCAHGRPSLVPLISTSAYGTGGGAFRGRPVNWKSFLGDA